MRRWSVVFPLGMAALTSLQLSTALHEHALAEVGTVLAWVALAAWAIVAAGTLRHAITQAAGNPPRTRP